MMYVWLIVGFILLLKGADFGGQGYAEAGISNFHSVLNHQ